ncbi:MAG TPA: hypothetical protein VM243_06890 [Phycisphaerae bacterium]|nr:hypothetical protein [Phycisphaerae bacterium]
MQPWLSQVGQTPTEGDGFAWHNLLYLLIIIIVPVLNAIKDRYVERTQSKAARAKKGSKLPDIPKASRAQSGLPMAKPVVLRKGSGFQIEPPQVPGAMPGPSTARAQATPQEVARRRARPAAPRPAPTAETRPTAPRPVPAPSIPPRAAPPAKPRKSLADVRAADPHVEMRRAGPRVDVRAADPGIDLRKADPTAELLDAEPVIEATPAAADSAAAAMPIGPSVFGRRLTREELRRVVILKEIFGPPVGLRRPGELGAGYGS